MSTKLPCGIKFQTHLLKEMYRDISHIGKCMLDDNTVLLTYNGFFAKAFKMKDLFLDISLLKDFKVKLNTLDLVHIDATPYYRELSGNRKKNKMYQVFKDSDHNEIYMDVSYLNNFECIEKYYVNSNRNLVYLMKNNSIEGVIAPCRFD